MTPARCVGEPVSWLRIERYVLAELPAAEMDAVRAHLEACGACRACVEHARAPRSLPALVVPAAAPRSLPALVVPAAAPEERRAAPPRRAWRRAAGAVTAALAAAAAILFALVPRDDGAPSYPGDTVRVRGGDLAMTLVRERDGEIVENPDVFAEADRFKVLVTCPPGHDPRFSVFVVQGDTIDRALPEGEIACGNRVALPGAFRIDGAVETTVCAAFGPKGAAIREGRSRDAAAALEEAAVCRVVRPIDPR